MRILNKRWITFLCFFVMAGIASAYALQSDMRSVAWVFAGAGVCAVFFLRRRSFLAVACLGALCLGSFIFIQTYPANMGSVRPYTEYTIIGTVCDYPQKGTNATRYLLSDVTLSDGMETLPCQKNIQLSCPNDTFEYGDVLTMQAMVFPPEGETMPGSFNEKLYLAVRNAAFSVYSADVYKLDNRWTLYTPFQQARALLEKNIDKIYSYQAAPVAKAMFLGMQDEITQEMYDSFSKTGITHILSISGLHIAFIAVLLDFLLSRIPVRRNARFILNIGLLVLYASITGFPASVVRAVLMAVLYLVARWKFKSRDTLVFLSVAMLITLLVQPAQLFMPGFLMSYGTVFGLLCLYPPIKRLFENRRKKEMSKTGQTICVSAAATGACAPLTAYFFGNVTYIAPLTNLYAIPLSSGILAFTGASALFSVVWIQAAQWFAIVSESMIKFLILFNAWMSQSVQGFVKVSGYPVWAGVAAFAAIFLASDYCLLGKRAKACVLAALFGGSVLAGVAVYGMQPKEALAIVFLDVGNGEAAHIACGGKNILLSNATKSAAYCVNQYAGRNGVIFDLFVLTECGPTHTAGAQSILKGGAVRGLFAYTDIADDLAEVCRSRRIAMHRVNKYDTLWEESGLAVTVEQCNYKAVTLLARFNGKNVCLFSGHSAGRSKDIRVSAPVLRLAGEGAKSSMNPGFLQAVAPKYAVVSVYENNYGLPAPETLRQLSDAGVQVYRTDMNYTITLTAGMDGTIQMRAMNEDT